VDAPTNMTLRIDRPPFCVALTLAGRAEVAVPAGSATVLHTEQGGYASDPRLPTFNENTFSFSRLGSALY